MSDTHTKTTEQLRRDAERAAGRRAAEPHYPLELKERQVRALERLADVMTFFKERFEEEQRREKEGR